MLPTRAREIRLLVEEFLYELIDARYYLELDVKGGDSHKVQSELHKEQSTYIARLRDICRGLEADSAEDYLAAYGQLIDFVEELLGLGIESANSARLEELLVELKNTLEVG